MSKEFKRDLLPNCRKKGLAERHADDFFMTEVKNIEISKDMLCYIIICRDRHPFFSDEMLQMWVEDKVRYAQQVLGGESEKTNRKGGLT